MRKTKTKTSLSTNDMPLARDASSPLTTNHCKVFGPIPNTLPHKAEKAQRKKRILREEAAGPKIRQDPQAPVCKRQTALNTKKDSARRHW